MLFKYRFEQLGKFAVGYCPKVSMVEPFALLEGEFCTTARAMLEREFGDKLIHAHYLGIIAGIPAEQGQEVYNSLWQVAALAITTACVATERVVPFEGEHRETEAVAVALAEFAFTVGFEQQWQVYELRGRYRSSRRLRTKVHAEEPRAAIPRRESRATPSSVVVDNIGKVISRQVIGTLIKYLVVEDVALDSHTATQQVVDFDIATRLDAETHHILSAVVDEALYLVGRQCERIAHRHTSRCVILEVGNLLAFGIKFFGGIESNISFAGIEKHLHMLAINITTLALLIRSVGATFAHTPSSMPIPSQARASLI